MRVLIVHDEPVDGGYGAEAYIRRLVEGLRDAGDTVELLAGERQHHGITKALDLWDPVARDLVEERAKSFRPDVVHFHNIARELSASVLSAARHVPAVMTFHDLRLFGATEHSWLSARGRVERAGARRIRSAARSRLAVAVGVTDRVCDALRADGFAQVSTVRVPAADPVGVLVPAQQCRDVVVAGRLAADKGIDIAIDAFDAASDGIEATRLLIAGDGPQRDALERRARRLGSRVSFLGWLNEDELSGLLGRSRVVIVASQTRRRPEGSSLSAVEAAMHGRPVIASSDPAVSEVVTGLEGGLVVPGDTANIDGFTDALRQVLTDDALAGELATSGRSNAVRLHSIPAVAAATRAVYQAAVDGRSS